MTEGYEAAWDLFTKAEGAAQRDKAHLVSQGTPHIVHLERRPGS